MTGRKCRVPTWGAAHTELLQRLAIRSQQDGLVGLSQTLGGCVGINHADDRRGRNGDRSRTGVDQGDGHPVEERSGHRVLQKVKSLPLGVGRTGQMSDERGNVSRC